MENKPERKPSEIIEDFLALINTSYDEYNRSKSRVEHFDSKTFTWTHDLEDAPDKQTRNRLTTAWQRELRERRKEKDNLKLWENLHKFGADAGNKAFLKRVRHIYVEQVKMEEHLSIEPKDREFKRRVGDDGAN